jgi:cytoskeletal protein CcmA (bactofilin family)
VVSDGGRSKIQVFGAFSDLARPLPAMGRMRWNRRNQTVSEPTGAALITEGSRLEGTCAFNGSVVISGHVKGEIQATGTLSIGRGGRVEARLRAPIVIIEGEVIGSIIATERIELREQARVRGDLETPALVIEESAVFEGQTKQARGESRRDGAGVVRSTAMTTVAASS